MRFLVVTKSRESFPPDVAPMLLQAMRAWVEENRTAGRIEDVWGFAGIPGGGGIFNVESLEELDGVMAAFPFGNFSDVEVYGLVDIDGALDGFEATINRMMEAMGGG